MNRSINLDWLKDTQPKVMGVLNVTPDSFYDGGSSYRDGVFQLDRALNRVEQMLREGADIVDVGGESTRPGAQAVSAVQESDRVLPVIEAIIERFDVQVSVDTSSAVVMSGATQLGASLINDVRALRQEGALQAAASSGAAVCLMHMQGAPATMQVAPSYTGAVKDVYAFLSERKSLCVEHGICEGSVLVDPGIGFGKKDEHNLELLKGLGVFSELGPVLLGVSRKSMFGRLLGRDLNERLAGGLAVAMIAVQKGVRILRVHDVAETRDVLMMLKLIEQHQSSSK